jgi:hypothetical protein
MGDGVADVGQALGGVRANPSAGRPPLATGQQLILREK